MTTHKSERRNYSRRNMRLPVALFRTEKGGRGGDFCFGEIRDTSVAGILVITSRVCQFEVGDRFTIYTMHEEQEDSVPAVEIKAELVWQDPANRRLGMKVIHEAA